MSTQALEAVTRSVTVDCTVEHAFATFTERIHEWWPLDRHSIESGEGATPQTVIFQGGEDGRLYERTTKGEELTWGEVLAWDPPHRLKLSWHPGREPSTPTEVEVRFTDEGGKTRVDLEHRGWERLGEQGADVRESYASGWQRVLGAYAESI